ncbi:hypothetical protein BDW59DRAFT_172986 [Aspergillus cavernicola]|uniref:Glucose-methanol-choline oxidoreductase N-terminal domain-containing protein n=1 Tax=Aspergillus cavernicola TaxID=176166 RepID=A0ABR4I932_9EURO
MYLPMATWLLAIYLWMIAANTVGNVVAGRLAENPDVKILNIPEITTPARAFETRGGPNDRAYKTTLINRPDYERVEKPNTRGKGTFDDWEEFGGDGWNWEGVKEYFDKSANYHDDLGLYPKLRNIGRSGPLHITHAELVPELHTFRDALKEAWVSKGEKLTDDIYSGEMLGLTHCVNTIYKGLRSSSWSYLTGKGSITVLSSSHAKRLIIKDNAVVGAEVHGPQGEDLTFTVSKEVIVSSGVYETPKLLLLSGIGPQSQLASYGIETTLDSPHVGKNLLDHPILAHVFRLKDGVGLDDHLLRAGPEKEGAWSLELVGFPRIDERLLKIREYFKAKEANGGKDPFGPANQPHFEIDFVPMFSDAFQWHFPVPKEGNWLTVIVDLLRPISKPGYVKLRSTNPLEVPFININFLENQLDVVALREGVRFVDDIILHGDGMKDLVSEDHPWPMPRNSDEAMNKLILERSQTWFYPCGTCRLSKDIGEGVVDGQLKVHGIKNLRDIDASVMPVIPDCRIQNAVYMIGENGADIIKAEYKQLY